MKTKLPFLSGSNESNLVLDMRRKQNFALFFFFVLFHAFWFLFHIFYLVDGRKVSQKTLKVEFFNKEWKMVGRPDFPSFLPVTFDRCFACKSGPVHEISLIQACFERVIPSA